MDTLVSPAFVLLVPALCIGLPKKLKKIIENKYKGVSDVRNIVIVPLAHFK